MSEKPADVFLGVIDFFGILVPGISLLILQGSTLAHLAAISVPQAQNWWDWVPALVAAYVVGHFLLGLGVPLNRLASLVFPESKDRFFQAVREDVPLPPNVTRTRSHARQVEPPLERVPLRHVPGRERVEHRGHVLHAQHEVVHARRFPHRAHAAFAAPVAVPTTNPVR